MSETIQKNDFIEIEFTGKSDGKIFDTTNPEEAEEIGIKEPKNIKPLIISVGNQMLLQGLDEFLEGKELNKEYTTDLQPEKAFGKRDPRLIKTYSLPAFKKNNIDPYPGMVLQLDNTIARVLSVSGGRVMVDFNNPLAGKEVSYNFKMKKKITDDKEKINALQDFFFKQKFEFEIVKETGDNQKEDKKQIRQERGDSNSQNSNSKKIIFKNPNAKPFIQIFGERFKEITCFEFEVEEKPN